LVFEFEYLSWTEANDMTFTGVELLVKEANKWAEEAPRHRKR
jgi:hypothetical protein